MGKKSNNSYHIFKKDLCELCGFIPVNICQLDVDHIDGNHLNNSQENLQTLCANCHRLKTFLNKDGPYKRVKN
jgi:5-methylcytosine-specific restriction endonuclease McrA